MIDFDVGLHIECPLLVCDILHMQLIVYIKKDTVGKVLDALPSLIRLTVEGLESDTVPQARLMISCQFKRLFAMPGRRSFFMLCKESITSDT